jgi:signal peptidase II
MATMSEKPSLASRLWPLVAAALVIAADQFTKALIVAHIPTGTVGWAWGGDFFWLTHQRNTGVAFSLGNGLPDSVRHVAFIAIPLVVLVGLAIYAWRDKSLTSLQRWALGLILGGGLGNILDRMFRPEGVVDFLSVRLYGFLGMERFATFNVADSAVTIGGGLVILSLFLGRRRK